MCAKKYGCKIQLTLNKKTRIFKNTNNFLFLGRDINGKYCRYRRIKRKLKNRYKKYISNEIKLNSLVSSYICYKGLCKRNLNINFKR